METRISLLEELTDGSDDAWSELTSVYQPLVATWLRNYDLQPSDAEDLSQDVMTTLLKSVRDFDHNGRVGAFRKWLRSVTTNRALDFFRAGRRVERPSGGSTFQEMLQQLQDPASDISRQFDREHDLHLLNALLQRVSAEFQESTMDIFRRHVMLGQSAASISRELEISPTAVYMTKSRILRRLRELAPDFMHDVETDARC